MNDLDKLLEVNENNDNDYVPQPLGEISAISGAPSPSGALFTGIGTPRQGQHFSPTDKFAAPARLSSSRFDLPSKVPELGPIGNIEQIGSQAFPNNSLPNTTGRSSDISNMNKNSDPLPLDSSRQDGVDLSDWQSVNQSGDENDQVGVDDDDFDVDAYQQMMNASQD